MPTYINVAFSDPQKNLVYATSSHHDGCSDTIKGGIIAQLGVALDERGNVKTDAGYMSSVPAIFSAGDMRRGQSLIVWAISEGREAARAVDEHLMGFSLLPTKGGMDLPRV